MMAMLEKDTAADLIDRPIDEAVEQFRLQWSNPVTSRACHKEFGRLVRAVIAAMAGTHGRVPVAGWCRDWALDLLQLAYRGTHDNGYEGALLDILYPPDPLFPEGIDGVLIQLASIIKARLREAYMQSVFERHMDPCDPELRLAIAEEIQHRYYRLLTPELRRKQPFELAGQIPELLTAIRDTRQHVDHLAADPLDD